MSENDQTFFYRNISNVNKKVNLILFYSAAVPVVFSILTALGLWIVPHSYSLSVFLYALITSLVYRILIKKNVNPFFLMYFGIFVTSGMIFLLGFSGVITVTISFALPPLISCLYYNRKVSIATTTFCFILSVIAYWNRSFSVPLVVNKVLTPSVWFFKNITGLVIEYIFLFIITYYLSNITHNILQRLVLSMERIEVAHDELKLRNREIQQISSELQEKYLQIDETQFKIIQFVAQCLGSHDLFTGRHVIHTQKYVELICHELVRLGFFTEELTPAKIELFKNAAFLHDIGKIHVPEGILNKIGKFTNEEFDMMKAHTTEGYELLDFLPTIKDGEFNRIAKEMALCHHEKWDGSGYPNKIKGTDIPLSARILAAADVMDAILSERLYKKPKSIEEAIEIFESSKGTHFEPCIVKAVINVKDKIAAIDKDFKASEEKTNAKEKEWWQRYHAKIKS